MKISSLLSALFLLLCTSAWPLRGAGTGEIVTTGSIGMPGETDTFAFTVPARSWYYFDSLTNGPGLDWSLTGPGGAVVEGRSFSASDAGQIADPAVMLRAGDYTLAVDGAGDATGGYAFRLVDFADAALLTPGALVTNSLAPGNRTELYQFTAAAGDRFVFDAGARTGLGSLRWRLYDPNGFQVFNQNFSDAGTPGAPVSMPLSGRYVLALEGQVNEPAPGGYSFTVTPLGNEPLPPVAGTEFLPGDLLTGTLAPNTPVFYKFTLASYSLVAVDNQTNVNSVTWSLTGPSGSVIGARPLNSSDWANNFGPVELAPGTYQIAVRSATAAGYRFALLNLGDGQTLTLGASTAAALNPASATVAYKFNAAAGTGLFLNSKSVGGVPNAYWRLIDPFGKVAAIGGVNSDLGPVPVTASGIYALLLEGYVADAGAGTVEFEVLAVTDKQRALTLGQVMSDTIEVPGQKIRYSFTLPSARQVYFDSRTNVSAFAWSLAGPSDSLIENRGFSASDAQSIGNPVIGLPAGAYTLTVDAQGDRTGTSQFALIDLSGAAAFVPGTPVSGSLSPANGTVIYSFEVPAAGSYYYDSLGVSGANNAYLRVMDPDGAFVIQTSLGSDFGPVTLAPGSYRLLAEGYIGDSGDGTYSFNFGPTQNGSQSLAVGDPVNGSLTVPGQQQTFTFTLPSATRLYFDVRQGSSPMRWSLDGPSGELVNGRPFFGSDGSSIADPAIQAAAGSYTLTVRAVGDETGPFSFRLLNFAAATPLTPGTETPGTLNPGNSTQIYRFSTGTAGEFYYDFKSANGIPNAWVRIVDPWGGFALNGPLRSDFGPFTLPAGDYFLLVEGYFGDADSGSYSFNLTPVTDQSAPLVLGTPVSGSIVVPGQEQRYTFTLTVPSQLYFDSLTNNSQLRWDLTGPTGLVVNNRPFNGSDAQSIGTPVVPVPPGSYTLTVSGAGDFTGPLAFRMLDLATAAPLPVGGNLSAPLAPGNSTHAYRLNLAAAGRYFFDFLSDTNLGSAYVRLLGSGIEAVFATGLRSDAGPFDLDPGVYTLLIEGYIGEAGNGSYTARFAPVNDAVQNLTLGQTANGAVLNAGQRQTYRFSLPAAARLYFDARVNAPNLRWSLEGPGGLLVNERSFGASDGINIADPVLECAPGDYSLIVSGSGDTAGSYSFRLFDLATAAPAAPGTTVNNPSFAAATTDAYKFTAAAGDRFSFAPVTVTGMPNALWRLVGPYGGIIFSRNLSGGAFTNLLDAAGSYTLLVEDYIVNTGPASYSFLINAVGNVPPAPYEGSALTLGETVTGALPAAGSTNAFTFTLAAPKKLYFDALANDTFVWNLRGPAGAVVENRSFQGSDSYDFADPVLDLPAGVYQLVIGGKAGTYRFRVLDLGAADALTPGSEVNGTLAPAMTTAIYRFTGTAGARFAFDALGATGFTYSPRVRLYAPAGNILAATTLGSDLDTFTAPQNGTYFLTVEGRIYDPSASGTYTFKVVPIAYATNALTLGGTVTGTIANAGVRHFYSFALSEARTLYLDAMTNSQTAWRIESGNRIVIDWRGMANSDSADSADPSLRLAPGNYTLVVAGQGFSSTGLYQFRLLDFAGAAPLTPGTPVTGTLQPGRSTALYRFPGTAGQRIAVDGQPSSGFNYTPTLRIFAPLGNILDSTGVSSDLDTMILPQTGEYVVSVEGRIYETQTNGTYAFTVVPIGYTTNQLVFGELVSGSIGTVGARSFYTFQLPTAATLYFDALTNSDAVWRLDAGPFQVVNWRSFRGSDGVDLQDPALSLPAGSYTLTVAGSGFAAAGDFRFRMLDFAQAAPAVFGAPVSGALTPANATALYRYAGVAGARIAFDFLSQSGFTYAPATRIYGPHGNIVAAHSGARDIDSFILGESGGYTVTVEGRIYDSNASGDYSFNVVQVAYPTNSLSFGTIYDGTVTNVGERHVFNFTLPAAGTIYVDPMSNAPIYWRLDGSFGQVIDWRGFRNSDAQDAANPAVSLPAGSYTLTLAGESFTTTGGYRFRVLKFGDGTAFAAGTLVTNTLAGRGTAIYRFNAAAGQRFYFDGIAATGFTYAPLVRIYAPGGQILGSSSVANNQEPFTAFESGPLTVTVESRIYETAENGGFAFNVVPLPENPAQPLFDATQVPDLVVTGLEVLPASGIQSGGSMTVRWTTRNNGAGATGRSFSDRVIVRNGALVLADALLVYDPAAVGNGPIAPGTGRARELAVGLPDGTISAGTLQVTVSADTRNALAELDEANNSASVAVLSTLAPYPDLIVENITATPAGGWPAGSVVTVAWRVRNQGAGPATGDWTDTVVVRNTNTTATIFSGGTNYLGAAPGNGPIAPGAARDRSIVFQVPAGASAYGNFAISVTSDTASQVFEYNSNGVGEQNNSSSLSRLSAPDLRATSLAVTPPGVRSGGPVTLNWRDENGGNVPIQSVFYDRIRIMNPVTFEVVQETTVSYNPAAPGSQPVAPGGWIERSATFTMPNGPAGAGAFLAAVESDTYLQLPEYNPAGTGEANNTASIPFSSALAPYPDLRVVNLSVQPPVLGPGTNVTIFWQDTNSGNGLAVGSWYDRIVIANTNTGATLLDTAFHYNAAVLGAITNGTARGRSYAFALPAGLDAGNLAFTVTADLYNNLFEHNAGGTGESNNSQSIVRAITIGPAPDLVVASLVSTNRAIANETVTARFRIENRGTAAAAGSLVQRLFLSTSPAPGSGALAGQVSLAADLAPDGFAEQTVSFLAPSTPGTYWLSVRVDAAGAVAESREDNNLYVAPGTLTVDPTYSATVSVALEQALAGTPVPIRGQATLTGGGPAAFQPVAIHIRVRGTSRTFTVLSGADGAFTNLFHPLASEAGVYEVAAAHPNAPAPLAQDSFTLIGMSVAPVGLVLVNEGETVTNFTRVDNLSDVPLTGLTVEVVTNQPNLVVSAALDANALPGFASTVLRTVIRSLDATILQSPVILKVRSAEGASADFVVTTRVEPLRPQLTATPGTLSRPMQRGLQTPLAFTVENTGGLPTGPLQVVIPSVPWLSLASAATLPPLAPGSNVVVTLLLTPAFDLPLGDYTGRLVVQSTNAAMQLPFSFRAISDAKGNLLVAAEDEYTYFAAGSPRVTNALVSVRDVLSGVTVATNSTGADGSILFSNLVEAHYLIEVTAPGHNSFRQSALVLGGGTTNVTAFLTRQTVQYSFTVTPTTIEDRYTFEVASVFETQVPVPVVTIEPASLNLANYPEDEFQVIYTIRNHGLIAAESVDLNIPSTPQLQITALVTNLGKLEANAVVTVPVLIRRVAPQGLSPMSGGACSVTAGMLWNYLCGPNVVDKSTAFYMFDSRGCDLVSLYQQVYDLVPDGGGGGGGGPVITSDEFFDYLRQFQVVTDFEAPAGYHFECKASSPPPPEPGAPLRAQAAPGGRDVCAKVQIRLNQKAVLTRDAFKATLEIDNDVGSPLEDVEVNLVITDLSGFQAVGRFAITAPEVAGLTGVDGNGVLPANTVGAAHWTLIPTLDAAPSQGFTVYLVSGTLNYRQDGAVLSVPLAPAPIQVYPQPELRLRYFHERNVYSDDPFTPEIEPAVPYALAVQVSNAGFGAARNLSIASGKPEIVDNEKGLLIDFKILEARLENEAQAPGLNVNFGGIAPGTNKVARWFFSSSLQGSFTNFDASFSQQDPFGLPRLSLVQSVEIHELTRSVLAGGAGADDRIDFLVNDLSDPAFLPDTLYLSDGSSVPVRAVTNATVSGLVAPGNLQITVQAGLQTNWAYLRIPDPGQGQYHLNRVRRGDNTVLAMGTNVWSTDRFFFGGDIRPSRTNLVHIFDQAGPGVYTLEYVAGTNAVADATPPSSAVAALPAATAPEFMVEWAGTDNADGSGIAAFDVYVSTNGGPFGIWISGAAFPAALFSGAPNTSYAFYTRAIDFSGNREAAPAAADATAFTSGAPNVPPVLAAIPAQTVVEGALFTFAPGAQAEAGETLTWRLLEGSPAGALISPANGRIAWQTGAGQGGTTNRFAVAVSDNGSPSLSATQTFNVIVTALNRPPAIVGVPSPVQAESGLPFQLQLIATDPNPRDTVVWELSPGAPAGLSVNPATGLLSWTPSGAQAPSTNLVAVTVRDNGTPPLSNSVSIVIVAILANHPPVLDPIADAFVSVLDRLAVTNRAADPDAGDLLSFSLEPGAPAGAQINPVSGLFAWTPIRAQAGGTNVIGVRVTDNGAPAKSDTRSFTVVVGHFAEVMLGSAVVPAGSGGVVPIAIDASAPVTNLSFILSLGGAGLGNLSLSAPVSPLADASIAQLSDSDYSITLRTLPGLALQGPQTVSVLSFNAAPGLSSRFVPLRVSSISALRAGGAPIAQSLESDGRITVVSGTPLLEAARGEGEILVTIYGAPGVGYALERASGLSTPIQWTQVWTGSIDNLSQVLPFPSTSNNGFFRARLLP